MYLQIEALPEKIDETIIALKIRVDNKDYRRDIRNFIWNELKENLDKETNIQKPKRFGSGKTMTVAEIRNFKTKRELFNAIKEANSMHRYLEGKINFPSFASGSDYLIGEDMLLINGVVPDKKMGSEIILITCKREDEDKLKEFIKNEDGIVFVFEDEPSMDQFRRLFQDSKFLSYISGIENFIDKKEVLTFLNESTLIKVAKEIGKYVEEHIWVLKDEKDEIEIEGFHVISPTHLDEDKIDQMAILIYEEKIKNNEVEFISFDEIKKSLKMSPKKE